MSIRNTLSRFYRIFSVLIALSFLVIFSNYGLNVLANFSVRERLRNAFVYTGYDAKSKASSPLTHQLHLEKLHMYPGLASIVAVNMGLNITHSVDSRHINLTKLIEEYVNNQNELLKSDLKFKDLTEKDRFVHQFSTITDFLSNSTYNPHYTLQTFRNVCIDTSGSGKLVFVVPPETNSSLYLAQFQHPSLSQRQLSPGQKEWMRWLPLSYTNQYSIKAISSTEFRSNAWDWYYLPGTTMHQISWNFNVAHHFHEQIWPVFMQLYFFREFNTNPATFFLSNRGCKSADHPSMSYPLTVDPGFWQFIIQMFLHMFVSQSIPQASIVRVPQSMCPSAVVCFNELIVADMQDSSYGMTRHGSTALRKMREIVRKYLKLDSIPIQSTHSKPIRISIISRLDSGRRRILNADEFVRHLQPNIDDGTVIVNHFAQFGTRPYYEQLAAFASSDILIAPHGAHMTFSFMLSDQSAIFECYPDPNRRDSWIGEIVKSFNITRLEPIGIPDPDNLRIRETAIKNSPLVDPYDRYKILQICDMDFRLNITEICALMLKLTFGIRC